MPPSPSVGPEAWNILLPQVASVSTSFGNFVRPRRRELRLRGSLLGGLKRRRLLSRLLVEVRCVPCPLSGASAPCGRLLAASC